MANVAVSTDFTTRPLTIDVERWTRRLRAFARLLRIAHGRHRALRQLRAETSDPRLLADIGIEQDRRNYRWLNELARALGGRP